MDLGIAGKAALITGGTSGIGLAIAQRLGAEGCSIAICGRKRERLDAAIAVLNSINAKGLLADICKPADVAALIADVIAAFGRIDIVVSNAGTHLSGRFDEVATEDLVRHFRTKIAGPFELARCVAPHMRQGVAASSSSSGRPARCRRPMPLPRPSPMPRNTPSSNRSRTSWRRAIFSSTPCARAVSRAR